jgi:hypothetical protein
VFSTRETQLLSPPALLHLPCAAPPSRSLMEVRYRPRTTAAAAAATQTRMQDRGECARALARHLGLWALVGLSRAPSRLVLRHASLVRVLRTPYPMAKRKASRFVRPCGRVILFASVVVHNPHTESLRHHFTVSGGDSQGLGGGGRLQQLEQTERPILPPRPVVASCVSRRTEAMTRRLLVVGLAGFVGGPSTRASIRSMVSVRRRHHNDKLAQPGESRR